MTRTQSRSARTTAHRSCSSRRTRTLALEPLELRACPAVFTPDLFVDENDGDTSAGDLSLREAVILANLSFGADEIHLGPGVYTLSLAGAADDAAASGDLDIRTDLAIFGAGAGATTIEAVGLNERLFEVLMGGSPTFPRVVRVEDLTMKGGRALGTFAPLNQGGAMRADFYTDVTISRVHFLDNQAPATGVPNLAFGLGGAISANGVTTIESSRFEGNHASNSGGALYLAGNIGTDEANRNLIRASILDTTFDGNHVLSSGGAITSHIPLTIEQSTFTGNVARVPSGSAGQGGAIDVQASIFSSLTLTNSTLSGNTAVFGGAISHFRPINVFSSTIALNQASRGGGMFGAGATVLARIENSIIAGNTATLTGPDISGTITSLGHNLIGNTAGGSGFAASDLLDVDPQLEPLADNGGLTATQALRSTSPAIDAALTSSSPATDQRGEARPQGAAADIGAYEARVNGAPLAADDSYATVEDTPLVIDAPGVLANDSDPEGNALAAILIDGPSHGTLDLAPDGSFVYVPTGQFFGQDSFTYMASDGSLVSEAATVTIDVASVNDAPSQDDATFTIAEESEAGTVVGTLLAADVEGDAISYAIVAGNDDGALAIDPDSGQITVANPELLDYETRPALSLTVRATDAHGDWDEALVSILLEDVAEVVPLLIDILPASADNAINRKSHGKLEVAIYSTATFDARDIDVQTLTFGRTGDENSLSRGPKGPRHRYVDLNGDGRLDLVVTFEIELAGFLAGDTRGLLKGRTHGGQEIGGSDAVRIR
jgi:hypothetical protein